MNRFIINLCLSVGFVFLFTGCVGSSYNKYYKSYFKESISELKEKYPKMELLKDSEEPIVYSVSDLNSEVQKLKSKRYVLLGYSSFNGKFEKETKIIDLAKDLGAKVAIYTWKYTNTQTNSGVLALPKTNYSNTYISGNVGGTYYSGTGYTKSTGTSYTPYTVTQRRFDQTALFFVKSNYPYDFGTSASTMITRDERIKIGSNGVRVNVIIEDTPAYKSNLLVGDIILSINSKTINSKKDFSLLSDECVDSKDICNVEVYRNGNKKNIEISF